MARKVRVEYPGAVYHVMSRGNRREAIFLDDKDRYRFLDTLAEACERTGFLIHSYVLMTNHYHLLLETPEANLVAGMRWLQGTYTIRFNIRHGLAGHLLQGRYKAIPVDPDESEYFRMVSEYIHLNPARAGLLAKQKPDLASYAWSSYRAFIGGKPFPSWLTRRRVFDTTGLRGEGPGARRRYRLYMGAKVSEVLGARSATELESEWRQIRGGWYLGGAQFRDCLEELADRAVRGKRRASFDHSGLQGHDERVALEWLRRALSALGMKESELAALRPSDPRKQAVVWLLRSRTVVSGAWLDNRLTVGHASNISRAVLAYRGMPADRVRRRLKKIILQVCKD
jgi:putative transposase